MDHKGRRSVVLLCVVSAVVSVTSFGARATGQNAPQPTGPRELRPDIITGESTMFTTDDIALLRIRFEAGARTFWHVHENPQIFFVEDGVGRIQIRGEKPQDVRPGEVVFMPANIPHWHGASASEAATCVHAYPGGVAITMMEEVTEDEYLGRT